MSNLLAEGFLDTFATSIPTPPVPIPGGPTAGVQGPAMLGGGSIILSPPMISPPPSARPPFLNGQVLIIAPLA